MPDIDAVVIDTGAVGLAVARQLALDGREAVVIERSGAIVMETTLHNSEVIHAGLYYPAGSIKAKACGAGPTPPPCLCRATWRRPPADRQATVLRSWSIFSAWKAPD